MYFYCISVPQSVYFGFLPTVYVYMCHTIILEINEAWFLKGIVLRVP